MGLRDIVKAQAQRGTAKFRTGTSKANWTVLKGGICAPRSTYYSRPLPHVITSKVSINKEDEFKICSWCGGRKK